MKLHKAFSSLITFPKINNKNKRDNIRNKKIKKDIFLTLNIPDDVNFARNIKNKFEKKLLTSKMHNMKLWKKGSNNIYSRNWTSNKNLFRKIEKNINAKKNGLYINTIDQNNYREIFKTESKNIFNNYLTARNYEFVNQLKSKYLKLNTNIPKLLSNSKQLCFENYVSHLLQNEREKLNLNGIEYEKTIKKENYLLNIDIKKFENYQVNQNLKFQTSDKEVQKFAKANNLIYETVKMNIHENHTIMNKIQQIIKEIAKLEEYVLSVYKILGIDESEINLEGLDKYKINLNANNQIDIEKNIKNIFKQSDIIINKLFYDVAEELISDNEKLYYAINNKEKMILKKLTENEDVKRSSYQSEKEFKQGLQHYQKRYDEYMSEYISFLKYYEEAIEKYNLTEKNAQSSSEFQNYINYISEIKQSLNNKEFKRQTNDSINLIYGNIIIPCFEEVKKKEFFVEDKLKELEFYEKNDTQLFNKCVYDRKIYNRKKKIKTERKLFEEKEIQEKLKIFKKHKKLIIKDKYGYNIPYKKQIKASFSEFKLKRK